MRAGRIGQLTGTVFLALLATSGLRAATDGTLAFRLDSLLVEGSTLGSKRAGLMCLPAGTLFWRDVAAADRGSTERMVRQIVEDRLGPDIAVRTSARIMLIKVRSCAKHYALGDAGALSGSGEIIVQWTGSAMGDPVTTTSRFSFTAQPVRSGGILAAAMHAAVADLAERQPNAR